MLDLIAFDADDTLWHNERLYRQAEKEYAALLRDHVDEAIAIHQLLETEKKNIPLYGYGIKSFALSMIEAGINLSNGEFGSPEILSVIDIVKSMLTSEVELLDHVYVTINQLAKRHSLMLLTKGDLRDQEKKLRKSGLKTCFQYVEIVPEKDTHIYTRLLEKHNVLPERFLMVGNSLKSDILPVLSIGAHAVHIPYPLTWAHEQVTVPQDQKCDYHVLGHIGELPGLIDHLWTT